MSKEERIKKIMDLFHLLELLLSILTQRSPSAKLELLCHTPVGMLANGKIDIDKKFKKIKILPILITRINNLPESIRNHNEQILKIKNNIKYWFAPFRIDKDGKITDTPAQ